MKDRKWIVLALLMMMFYAGFFSGSLYAGSVTTVYLEPSTASFALYSGDIIRARVLLLDAAGTLATTLPDGTTISEGTIELASKNFPAEVEFADAEATTQNIPSTLFSSSPYTLSRDFPAYQEFAFTYNSAAMSETGDDEITATLKQGTTILASSKITVKILAPLANVYVARTGGINTLPNVLDELPPPQKDKSAGKLAGDSVLIDVFAAYAHVTNGIVDNLIFTDNIPAGFDTVTIGTSTVTLVNGHAAASSVEKTVRPSLTATDTAATQLAAMQKVFVQGATKTYIGSTIVPYTEIGTHNGDAGIKVINDTDASTPAPIASWINLDNAPASFKTNATHWITDTANFRPDKIAGVNIVALPITSITGTLLTSNAPTNTVSAVDAFNYVGYDKIPIKVTLFRVNGTPGTTSVYGAIMGYDKYNNPAPFYPGQQVGFDLLTTNGPLTSGIAITDASYGSVISGVITTTAAYPYQSFLPFKITSSSPVGLYINLHGTNPMDKKLIEGVGTAPKAVSFDVKNYVSTVQANGSLFPGLISVEAGGRDSVKITVTPTGTSNESSFQMTAGTDSGTAVKVNTRGAGDAADSVTIPFDSRANKAEQDVSFYTAIPYNGKVSSLASKQPQLRLIFTGVDNSTTFVYKPGYANISPADSRTYAPQTVSVALTKKALLDSAENHDTVATTAVSISDAFGNAYAGLYGTDSVNIEAARPVVEVFKSDGTTPFPGAKTGVNERAVAVSFDLSQITPDTSQAKVKVSAGASSGQFTVNLRALKNTSLENIFVPVAGVNKTPVEVFFSDQGGALIAPITSTTADTTITKIRKDDQYLGRFQVDIEAKDGIVNSLTELRHPITTVTPTFIFNAKPNAGKTVMTIAADGRDAEATSTTLTLNFVPVDTIPPVIGAVTASACSINIACTDNEGLNLKGSTVVVKDSTGKDITSTLPPPAITGDGTAAGSIFFTGVKVGLYTLDIVLKDTAGNITTGQKPANVTSCAVAACKSVNPAFAVRGRTLDVTITGENTNFGATSVVTFSDAAITVNSVTASSATEATPSSATEIVANITISATAAAAKSDVTVTTGFERITCPQAFEITENPTLPSCVSVEPSQVNAGDTTDVTITLNLAARA
ncbi:MAG: hypothetical protein NTV89_10825 [Proteobacteria bacterium]|nr:hypothetical protein [Pseudomonadota bacterium]